MAQKSPTIPGDAENAAQSLAAANRQKLADSGANKAFLGRVKDMPENSTTGLGVEVDGIVHPIKRINGSTASVDLRVKIPIPHLHEDYDETVGGVDLDVKSEDISKLKEELIGAREPRVKLLGNRDIRMHIGLYDSGELWCTSGDAIFGEFRFRKTGVYVDVYCPGGRIATNKFDPATITSEGLMAEVGECQQKGSALTARIKENQSLSSSIRLAGGNIRYISSRHLDVDATVYFRHQSSRGLDRTAEFYIAVSKDGEPKFTRNLSIDTASGDEVEAAIDTAYTGVPEVAGGVKSGIDRALAENLERGRDEINAVRGRLRALGFNEEFVGRLVRHRASPTGVAYRTRSDDFAQIKSLPAEEQAIVVFEPYEADILSNLTLADGGDGESFHQRIRIPRTCDAAHSRVEDIETMLSESIRVSSIANRQYEGLTKNRAFAGSLRVADGGIEFLYGSTPLPVQFDLEHRALYVSHGGVDIPIMDGDTPASLTAAIDKATGVEAPAEQPAPVLYGAAPAPAQVLAPMPAPTPAPGTLPDDLGIGELEPELPEGFFTATAPEMPASVRPAAVKVEPPAPTATAKPARLYVEAWETKTEPNLEPVRIATAPAPASAPEPARAPDAAEVAKLRKLARAIDALPTEYKARITPSATMAAEGVPDGYTFNSRGVAWRVEDVSASLIETGNQIDVEITITEEGQLMTVKSQVYESRPISENDERLVYAKLYAEKTLKKFLDIKKDPAFSGSLSVVPSRSSTDEFCFTYKGEQIQFDFWTPGNVRFSVGSLAVRLRLEDLKKEDVDKALGKAETVSLPNRERIQKMNQDVNMRLSFSREAKGGLSYSCEAEGANGDYLVDSVDEAVRTFTVLVGPESKPITISLDKINPQIVDYKIREALEVRTTHPDLQPAQLPPAALEPDVTTFSDIMFPLGSDMFEDVAVLPELPAPPADEAGWLDLLGPPPASIRIATDASPPARPAPTPGGRPILQLEPDDFGEPEQGPDEFGPIEPIHEPTHAAKTVEPVAPQTPKKRRAEGSPSTRINLAAKQRRFHIPPRAAAIGAAGLLAAAGIGKFVENRHFAPKRAPERTSSVDSAETATKKYDTTFTVTSGEDGIRIHVDLKQDAKIKSMPYQGKVHVETLSVSTKDPNSTVYTGYVELMQTGMNSERFTIEVPNEGGIVEIRGLSFHRGTSGD